LSKQESASTLPTSTIVQIINAMFMLMLAVLDLILEVSGEGRMRTSA